MTPGMQDALVRRLQTKILNNAEKIWMYDSGRDCDGADVVVVCYGITSRVAQRAIDMARAKGVEGRQVPADHRLAVPREADSRTGRQGEGVCRARAEPRADGARGRARGRRCWPRPLPCRHAGGSVHEPEDILQAIMEVAR